MSKRRSGPALDLELTPYRLIDLCIGGPLSHLNGAILGYDSVEHACAVWRANRERLWAAHDANHLGASFERNDTRWMAPEWGEPEAAVDFRIGGLSQNGQLVFGPPARLWSSGELIEPDSAITIFATDDVAAEVARAGGYRVRVITAT